MIDITKLPASIQGRLKQISPAQSVDPYAVVHQPVPEGLQKFTKDMSVFGKYVADLGPVQDAGQYVARKLGAPPGVQKLVGVAATLAVPLGGEEKAASEIPNMAEGASKLLRRNWSFPEEVKATIQKAAELTQKNGGVTINLKGEIPTEGFSVATSKATERIVPQMEFTKDHLAQYVQDNWKHLQEAGRHIGAWIDNGQVYMDVPKVFTDKAEAAAAALKADQLGIFDLKNFETIGKDQYEKIISDAKAAAERNSTAIRGEGLGESSGTKAGRPGQTAPTGTAKAVKKVIKKTTP